MAGKKGMAKYRRELKEQAVHLFLDEGWTYHSIAVALGIRDPDRVKKWVQAYRREGVAAFTKPKGHRPKAKTESPEEELARLRMENELLKKFHSELRKLELAKRNIG